MAQEAKREEVLNQVGAERGDIEGNVRFDSPDGPEFRVGSAAERRGPVSDITAKAGCWNAFLLRCQTLKHRCGGQDADEASFFKLTANPYIELAWELTSEWTETHPFPGVGEK
eukprot:1579809-Rhodomonas_salina.1